MELDPLVCSHHDEVIALGDVGDELAIGDLDTEPRPARSSAVQRADPFVEGMVVTVLLGQRLPRQHEVEPVEPALCVGGVGDRQVGDGQRVERAGVDPAALSRARRGPRNG